MQMTQTLDKCRGSVLNPCMVAAVIFDLDETLFARVHSMKAFVEDQLVNKYPHVFPDPSLATARFLELDNRGRSSKSKVYQTLITEFEVDDQSLATELFDHYSKNAWRFAVAFEGLDEAFNEVRALGAKIGIVTNGSSDIQLRSLLALNLDRLVDDYIISEAVGLRKPDARIFHLAARNLSVRTTDCIFVGDSPVADIQGAKQVGMKTIWFPNGAVWPSDGSERADAEIHSLFELGGVLKAL